MNTAKKQSIAVVGGGVAGIVASYLLQRKHDVTIFEKNDYLGGHTNTIIIPDGEDAGTAVDTGFIVLNDKTYPLFHRFLAALGVHARFSDMSFGFYAEESGLQYSGRGLSGLFANRKNLFRPSFLKLVVEIKRFGEVAKNALSHSEIDRESLGEFLLHHGFSSSLIHDYVVPLGAAIWSSPDIGILEFPAKTFLQFFNNHGLLYLRERPRWQTVVGGSHEYVKAFRASFRGAICLSSSAFSIARRNDAILIRSSSGEERLFDAVIIAAHADEALKLLADPSPEEAECLSSWSYKENLAVLHTDRGFLPPNPRAWASWNYRRERGEEGKEPVSVTYDMNRLQGLRTRKRYLVTLNPRRSISSLDTVKEILYTHPIYTPRSVLSQQKLANLNGTRKTWFCGSYMGYGFHEDAVRSAVQVGNAFGVGL